MLNLPDIYFIRHGETDWNAERRYQGRQNIPLNARGKRQADANGPLLRDLLARNGVDTDQMDWYVSPLDRAVETMQRVRKAFTAPLPSPNVDPRLVEISFGKFEGLIASDIADGLTAQGERDEEFWQFRPEGGENYVDVASRIEPMLAELKRPTIIVAHGGIARLFRVLVENVSIAQAVNWPSPQNAVLHFSGGKMRVYESEETTG